MKLIISFLLCFLSLNSFASIYVQEDTNGNLYYSDTPSQNAKTVTNLDVGGTISTKPVPTPVTESETSATVTTTTPAARQNYKIFTIITPADQATIQNQPVIDVEVKLEPSLQQGDTIQLILDGKPTGVPAANTHLSLNLLERGTFQLSAAILDSNQRVIQQSQPVTIYVHRNSLITSPAAPSSS